jgi:dihydrofolate synthase/folylpolyglutamate synthase
VCRSRSAASLLAHAQELGAELHLLGRDFGHFGDRLQWTFWRHGGLRRGGLANPGLRGACQLRNASAALTVVDLLRTAFAGFDAGDTARADRTGFARAFSGVAGPPGNRPRCGAQSTGGEWPGRQSARHGFLPRTIAVVGMLADKDIAGSLAPLAGKVDTWLLADLDVPRGASAAVLAGLP